MDINNLIAFIAVAEKKSFSRAAESLRLTQPAVSKRVAALESELSTRLFDRIGRNVHLTEAGQMLLPSAQKIRAELLLIDSVVRNPEDEVRGTLKIATTERISTHRLPPVLKAFRKTYPNVEINLQFAETAENLRAVENGTIELALCHSTRRTDSVGNDNLKRSPKLTSHEVWSEDLSIVTCEDHILTASNNVSVQKLATHPAVLPPPGSAIRELVNDIFQQLGHRLLISTEAHNFETIRSMVSIGIGWACLPKYLIDLKKDNGTISNADKLSVITVDELKYTQVVSVVNHNERTLSSSARAFTDLLLIPTSTTTAAGSRKETLEEST